MFGFGNSKQKKYKKALEEFLQKMMSVQDYFEIIQARGKGHAQMAEMLGVKVSDTDYWAKEHFEEYKSRLSESNDPLAEIELRLKNYSFIKKEMEGFINYAKELEMNLTQGFVDDYYATVATCKSLKMCETFFDVNSFDKYIDNQFIENDEKVTFSIICKYLHKREDRFEEIITIELIKNEDVIKQYVFRHNTLEKLDINEIDKSSYSSEIFFKETEVESRCIFKEEVNERYDYIVQSLTMIKRMKKYPTNFHNMFVKLRGLGVYSFNREIDIEVDKFKFLSWCSTYGIHLYDHSYKEIRQTQRDDADKETSLEFLKGLSQVYPFTYFIIDRHGLQPILDFSVNPENLVMVCRYHDSKLGLSWIFESFGPDHKMIDSTYKCGPEEEKTDKNQTEEDTEDLTYELNFDEFKGCDFYLKNEYEESVKFPDFHKIINGGITNSERYLKFTSKEGIFDSDELEREILRGVQMSFDRFINENPQVEKESSDETLELWFKFIKYCYCNEPETYELNEIFTFEPSELMIKAYEQTITWFREYYVDHENVASRLVEDENPSEVVVDKLDKISSEINTGDFSNLLNTESTKEISEKLQNKTGDRDMFEPDLKRGAFSTHKFELQKDDGIKVAEGWSLMLRSIIDGDYEVEEEAFFILPHVGRYGYTSDIVLFMHGNPFKEGEDYHQKILEKERKKSEYVDDIVMIDERDYEEFDSYDEAYDVWIKTVKLWIDDLDKKT